MRTLRAPFVVTAAVMVSVASACSSGGHENGTDNPPPPDAELDTFDAGFDLGRIEASSDVTTADAQDGRDATLNPPECPATDPGIGAIHKPCTAPASVRCSYEDLCPQHPVDQTQNVYICHDDGTGDHWTLASKEYVPSCPTAEPKTGDPCPCTIHMAFVACNYGLCEDFTRTYAACKGVDTFDLEWKVTPIACNPPEVDGGGDADASDAPDASDAD